MEQHAEVKESSALRLLREEEGSEARSRPTDAEPKKAPAKSKGPVTRLRLAIGISLVLVAVLGWWLYARQPGLADATARKAPALYQLSLNKFFFDELYHRFIVAPLEGFAEFCRVVDFYVVDKIVDIVGLLPRLVGGLFRPVQNGLVQFYALAMILGLTVFLLALAWKL